VQEMRNSHHRARGEKGTKPKAKKGERASSLVSCCHWITSVLHAGSSPSPSAFLPLPISPFLLPPLPHPALFTRAEGLSDGAASGLRETHPSFVGDPRWRPRLSHHSLCPDRGLSLRVEARPDIPREAGGRRYPVHPLVLSGLPTC
jgi:hypothetical protein